MRALQVLMACAMFGLIATAQAADNGVYAGIAVGQSKTDVQSFFDDDEVDEEDTGFKLLLGLRPLDWLGVEVNYVYLGEVSGGADFPDFTSFRVKQTGFGASGVLFYDIATFDLFAKAGLIRWDASRTVDTFFGRFNVSDKGTDLTWGAGAQARFGSLAARLEYERYEIDESDGFIGKPHLISLGLTWTFF
jgi:hypothetical protein